MNTTLPTKYKTPHSTVYTRLASGRSRLLSIVGPAFVLAFGVLGVSLYQFSHAATGTPELASALTSSSNWCMDSATNTTGNPITARPCTGASTEYFYVSSNTIKFSQNGDQCVQPQAGAMRAGTSAVLEPCNGTVSQDWVSNDASYKNASTGLCIAVANTAVDKNVILETCTGSREQVWMSRTSG